MQIFREEILPSERAFAFKMKLEALRRQGARTDLTSGHHVPKLSTDVIYRNVPQCLVNGAVQEIVFWALS